MAIQPPSALSCSDCLIEAIFLNDERRLRQLLSADIAEFCETYWYLAPVFSTSWQSFQSRHWARRCRVNWPHTPSRTACIRCSWRRCRPENLQTLPSPLCLYIDAVQPDRLQRTTRARRQRQVCSGWTSVLSPGAPKRVAVVAGGIGSCRIL